MPQAPVQPPKTIETTARSAARYIFFVILLIYSLLYMFCSDSPIISFKPVNARRPVRERQQILFAIRSSFHGNMRSFHPPVLVRELYTQTGGSEELPSRGCFLYVVGFNRPGCFYAKTYWGVLVLINVSSERRVTFSPWLPKIISSWFRVPLTCAEKYVSYAAWKSCVKIGAAFCENIVSRQGVGRSQARTGSERLVIDSA